jgi:hypothetical protein
MSITRRDLIATSIVAGALSGDAQTTAKSAYYEMRYFRMRSDKTEQGRRTNAFLSGVYLPAAKKAGAGPVGLFGSVIAPDTPFTMCLTSYPSLGAMQETRDKLAASAEYQKSLADFDAGEPAFEKMESWVLRAFDFFPSIEMLPADPKRPARVFELRTYESQNESLLARKIRMFGSGEVGIFRKCGAQPLMFAEAIAGSKLPHLSYMLGYENLAAREKVWAAFGADPDWVKLRTTPEFALPGMVVNISNSMLSVVNGSDIR